MLTAEELSRVCAERFEAENHRDVDEIIATLDDGVEYHVMSPSHLDGPEPLGVTAGELRGEEKFLVREFTEVVLETAAGPLQRRVDRIANGGTDDGFHVGPAAEEAGRLPGVRPGPGFRRGALAADLPGKR